MVTIRRYLKKLLCPKVEKAAGEPSTEAVDRAREFRQRVFGDRMLDVPVAELIREGRGETAADNRTGEG